VAQILIETRNFADAEAALARAEALRDRVAAKTDDDARYTEFFDVWAFGTQDTNAVRRGGEKMAERIRQSAQVLDARIADHLREGKMACQMDSIHQVLGRWDEAFTEKHISPGGCADLLALTLFFHFLNL
jgi:triphosphoribosyl-dephospho-CoA synthetase